MPRTGMWQVFTVEEKEALFWIGYSAVRSVSTECATITGPACKSKPWKNRERGPVGDTAGEERFYHPHVLTSPNQSKKRKKMDTNQRCLWNRTSDPISNKLRLSVKVFLFFFLLSNQRQKRFRAASTHCFVPPAARLAVPLLSDTLVCRQLVDTVPKSSSFFACSLRRRCNFVGNLLFEFDLLKVVRQSGWWCWW